MAGGKKKARSMSNFVRRIKVTFNYIVIVKGPQKMSINIQPYSVNAN